MRSLCLLAAFAVLVSSDSAIAKKQPVSIMFDDRCDGINVTIEGSIVVGQTIGCGQGDVLGGTIGTVRKFGRAITVTAFDPNDYTSTYYLQYPLVTGNAFCFFETLDGQNLKGQYCGTYSVIEGDRR